VRDIDVNGGEIGLIKTLINKGLPGQSVWPGLEELPDA